MSTTNKNKFKNKIIFYSKPAVDIAAYLLADLTKLEFLN